MKTTDFKSLIEVWEMKENAYKDYIESGKDYLTYIDDVTKDIIKDNKIRVRRECERRLKSA